MNSNLVINKTDALYERDLKNPTKVIEKIPEKYEHLLESAIITVKTDGTCGMLINMPDGTYCLMRRQDIKTTNRNYEHVMKFGTMEMIFDIKCFVSKMRRGSGKNEITVPVYFFQLDENNKPEQEFNHIIAFTPLMHNFGDDKYAISAIDGTNQTSDLKLFTTIFNGTPDIEIKSISAKELLENKSLMTVEIMGSKISNKYGFIDDRHFINPHGSIIYPKEEKPPIHNYQLLKNWFEDEENNRWANVEGIVVYFPGTEYRLKLHRSHLGMEKSWSNKKQSGFKFVWLSN